MNIAALIRHLGGDPRRQTVLTHLRQLGAHVAEVPVVIRPWESAYLLTRYVATDKESWRQRSMKNVCAFAARSRAASRELRRCTLKPVDVIFLFEALYSPGVGEEMCAPYIVYEDGTSAMARRMWPKWVPGPAQNPAYARLEGELYRRALLNFTPTHWARRSIIEDYGVPAERVEAVGMGCNLECDEADEELLREKRIVFAGYEFERKGVDVLLEAFAQLRRRFSDVSLCVLGLRISHPPEGVVNLGHVTDRAALSDLYRRSLVFVMPSRFDPVPTAVIEAMGRRLAIVVSDHCGAAEFVEHGVTGYIARSADARSLADCLEALISNPDHARAVGKAGFRFLQQELTWRTVAQRILVRTQEALSGDSKRRVVSRIKVQSLCGE